MATSIEIVTKEIGYALEIEEKLPMWKMPSIMGENFQAILNYTEVQKN